ncbi:type IV secretion protein Rhs [Capnocytophaga canimorsus]|uniref:DUF6531 domain-containing protein n=1 Tax=Capnocytophaga canimorsus TaxID=28188 RepID=UPI001ACE67DD|nr:DUF6531 domain-containing protein [Capnocytophaga canimorsus]GIM57492.1 type IV secretion protein Rhs [Capnocytophaga canimorsus]
MEAKEYSDKKYLGKVGDNLQNKKQESVKPINEQVEKHQKVTENPNASSLQKATSLGLSVVEGAKGAYDALSGIGEGVSESIATPLLEKVGPFKGQAILPVCKQTDPVIGVDVHMVMFPPSLAPVPMPHPYVGMLFNARDFVSCAVATVIGSPEIVPDEASEIDENSSQEEIDVANKQQTKSLSYQIGTELLMKKMKWDATVKFGGFLPRVKADTPTKSIPHFPMGPSFHPIYSGLIAKNHGHALLGSLLVVADDDPLTGSPAHLHNNCWDIGIISPHTGKPNRKGKKITSQFQLYVPSGIIAPIPWMRPVLTNPIPSPINILKAPQKMFNAGFAKLKRNKKVRKSSEKVISKLPFPCATKTKLSKLMGTGQSHPVEVAEGYFYTDSEDFSLPGILPLVWERTWYSYSQYQGALGHGWHYNYDMALGFDPEQGVATLRMNDGRGVDIYLPKDSKTPTFHRLEKLFLCLDDKQEYYVKDTQGLSYHFTQEAYPVKDSPQGQHLLQKVSDKNGHCITFEYTSKGVLKRIVDSALRVLEVESDNHGRITAIFAPDPNDAHKTFAIARYQYNEQGDMISHTDALNQSMYFEYENHLMVKEVWRNGTVWTFRYAGSQEQTKCVEVRGSGNLLHYTFDYTDPHCTIVTDSLGYRKEFHHYQGRVIKYIDPEKGEWLSHYNQYSELESESDPLGNTTAYMYDKWGNLAQVIEADGSFTQMGYYHPYHPYLITEATDPRGGQWQWTYDAKGNLIERTNPLGATTRLQYENGLLHALTDAVGATTELTYNHQKQLIKIQAPNEAVTLYQYDHLGQCNAVTNPNGLRQTREYDLLGRATTIRDFDDNTIDLQYDAMDNVIRYKDRNKDVRYTYKGLNKLTTRTDSAGTVRFEYDTEGQLRQITNQAGERYHFELDGNGKVTRETAFDGLVRSYKRNAAGQVTQIQRPNKRYSEYDYDPKGRIIRTQYHDGTQETFEYQHGFLARATNADAVVTFERDVVGNILKETCNGHEIHSTYDLLGRRTHIGSSLGADISQTFDVLGNVEKISSLHISPIEREGVYGGEASWSATMDYDRQGLEIQRTLSGGVVAQTKRDRLGRVRFQNAVVNELTTHLWREYDWNYDHRLASITDHKNHHTTAFEYDDRGFLERAIYNRKEQVWRTADKLGNLYQSQEKNDRQYQSSQLQYDGKWYYYYDKEGNLILKSPFEGGYRGMSSQPKWSLGSWAYEWNANGSLKKVKRSDGSVITFKYDAFGRRIEKKTVRATTHFVWDGNVPLHEWKTFDYRETTDNDRITWVFQDFVPVAKLQGDKSYSIISDHIGTPLVAIDNEGVKVWERELDIYGKVRKETKETPNFVPFLYAGQYYDKETELAYNRFRYYSPDTGAYISQDPIGLEGGLALYSYVHDSNTWIDIFGLYLHRPYIRVSTRMAVEKEANIINNRFMDANNPNKLIQGGKRRSYSIAEGKYHLGHKKGNEFWREKEKAEAEGLTQKQFNDRMNNPALYQIEDPYENMSHKHEKKKDKKLNSCNKK